MVIFEEKFRDKMNIINLNFNSILTRNQAERDCKRFASDLPFKERNPHSQRYHLNLERIKDIFTGFIYTVLFSR